MNTPNQSPTPRTDAEAVHASEVSLETRQYYVPADFARTLERENAELLEALERLLRATEADVAICPDMTVRNAYETNSRAFAILRAAIAKVKGGQP